MICRNLSRGFSCLFCLFSGQMRHPCICARTIRAGNARKRAKARAEGCSRAGRMKVRFDKATLRGTELRRKAPQAAFARYKQEEPHSRRAQGKLAEFRSARTRRATPYANTNRPTLRRVQRKLSVFGSERTRRATPYANTNVPISRRAQVNRLCQVMQPSAAYPRPIKPADSGAQPRAIRKYEIPSGATLTA